MEYARNETALVVYFLVLANAMSTITSRYYVFPSVSCQLSFKCKSDDSHLTFLFDSAILFL
jgi:hypothetical protein